MPGTEKLFLQSNAKIKTDKKLDIYAKNGLLCIQFDKRKKSHSEELFNAKTAKRMFIYTLIIQKKDRSKIQTKRNIQKNSKINFKTAKNEPLLHLKNINRLCKNFVVSIL